MNLHVNNLFKEQSESKSQRATTGLNCLPHVNNLFKEQSESKSQPGNLYLTMKDSCEQSIQRTI